jgi:hypothetical protein
MTGFIDSVSGGGRPVPRLVAVLVALAALITPPPTARAADDDAPAATPASDVVIRIEGQLRVLDSKHYRIHTDLDPRFAEELATRLDSMYEQYAHRLSEFRAGADGKTFEVYIFAKRADYMRLTGNRFPNTGGVFMPARNLLAAFLEGQGRDALRRTLQHEAFHQFAHTALSPDLPLWLNEGMAQYFEEGIWTGQYFAIGQVPPRRVRQLQEDMKAQRLLPFRTFMSLTHEEWGQNLTRDAERGATQYNQAWAMVHFLVHANNGREPYRPRLIQLLKMIHGGAEPDVAFREAFSDNIEGFQQRFVEWARTLAPTPEANMLERQDVLADLLTALEERGERFDELAEFRMAVVTGGYRLHYTKGRIKWQTAADPLLYFSDLDGRPFRKDELYFERRAGAPLPDVVCRPADGIQLRTRFHEAGGNSIEHEVLVQPTARR